MDNINETEGATGTQLQDISSANQTDRDLLLQILTELRLLSDHISTDTMFQKPILSIDEAAKLLGVSKKRMLNIIYIERSRLGRMPDFVCDAGGTIRLHILRDKFIEWVTKRRTRRGRPSKITPP